MKIWLYNHLVWYFQQLFPCKYHTTYRVGDESGELHVTVWRMWFGRCFNIEDWAVKE